MRIPKPEGGERELGIPTVTDRLIQQALLQVLQPILDPTFSKHSYGFRPSRNAHDAVLAAQSYVQSGRRIVVDVDLEKFFDRVNHDILMDRLEQRIVDPGVIRLIRDTYEPDIMKHVDDEMHGDREKRWSLLNLLRILQKHEADLKWDIRNAVDSLKMDVSGSSIREAKQRARSIKDEIASNFTRINGVAIQITGSGRANEVLKRQIAEAALRRPERVLLFNMAMVVILLIVGATLLQFIPLWAFPLLTGFVLTAVIVVNAFYLRSINQLTNESFIELMKLASA